MSDYITEKVTQGLTAGGVPIILGAPNLADEIGTSTPPSSSSATDLNSMLVYIDALQYSPAELADRIRELYESRESREQYRAWARALPSTELPIVRWAQRAKKNHYGQNNMMEPICKLCEYYHQYFDWSDEAPAAFD